MGQKNSRPSIPKGKKNNAFKNIKNNHVKNLKLLDNDREKKRVIIKNDIEGERKGYSMGNLAQV